MMDVNFAQTCDRPSVDQFARVDYLIGIDHLIQALEDRKYGYFLIFPHHSCENIQTYFEFLDTFESRQKLIYLLCLNLFLNAIIPIGFPSDF